MQKVLSRNNLPSCSTSTKLWKPHLTSIVNKICRSSWKGKYGSVVNTPSGYSWNILENVCWEWLIFVFCDDAAEISASICSIVWNVKYTVEMLIWAFSIQIEQLNVYLSFLPYPKDSTSALPITVWEWQVILWTRNSSHFVALHAVVVQQPVLAAREPPTSKYPCSP